MRGQYNATIVADVLILTLSKYVTQTESRICYCL
jgi:hypothetical protein